MTFFLLLDQISRQCILLCIEFYTKEKTSFFLAATANHFPPSLPNFPIGGTNVHKMKTCRANNKLLNWSICCAWGKYAIANCWSDAIKKRREKRATRFLCIAKQDKTTTTAKINTKQRLFKRQAIDEKTATTTKKVAATHQKDNGIKMKSALFFSACVYVLSIKQLMSRTHWNCFSFSDFVRYSRFFLHFSIVIAVGGFCSSYQCYFAVSQEATVFFLLLLRCFFRDSTIPGPERIWLNPFIGTILICCAWRCYCHHNVWARWSNVYCLFNTIVSHGFCLNICECVGVGVCMCACIRWDFKQIPKTKSISIE